MAGKVDCGFSIRIPRTVRLSNVNDLEDLADLRVFCSESMPDFEMRVFGLLGELLTGESRFGGVNEAEDRDDRLDISRIETLPVAKTSQKHQC